jgi:hypothetical protein
MASCARERHIFAMPSTVQRLARGAGATLLVFGITACDLSTGPEQVQTPIDLELDFCSNDVPVWFAYQNIGQPTTQVIPDAQGTVRFTASARVVLGMVWQSGTDYHSEFIYASNDELLALSGRACLEEVGTKAVNGTVSGVTAAQVAVVGMNFASAPLTGGNTSYSLTGLPDRPLDLLASRQNATAVQRIADRLVLRRTQNFANNATVPVIDFNAAEAVNAATANATVSGIFTGEFAYLQNNFFSQLETSHSLFYSENIGNGSHQFAAVPTTLLAANEYHDLILLSVDPDDASVRGVENYFRAASSQTLALGPPLEDPNITALQNTAYVRLRLILPTQASYDDAVSVDYFQQQAASVTTVRMWATLGYLRQVVNQWVLDIPNLSGAQGWQDSWGLRTGFPIEWTVTGYGGSSVLTMGAQPEDGEFIRYAIRQSEPQPGSGGAARVGPLARSVPRLTSNRR